MKTKIYSLTILAASAFALASCSDDWGGGYDPCAKETGQLAKNSLDVINGETIITTSRDGVNTSNFIVTIKNNLGEQVGQWYYSQMPELVTLPVATDYTVNVISHNQEKAAWEAPYFESETKTFDIQNNKITEVGTLTCKLANIRVSIHYSDELRAALGDDCKVTVIANDEGRLEFIPDETRSGYFQALDGSTTLIATLSGTIDGSYEEVRYVINDAAAGQHRKINYSFAGGNPTPPDENGFIDPSSGIQIDTEVIDETVEGGVNVDEDIISGTRPGQEDPEQGDQPGTDPEDPDNPDNPDDPTHEYFTFENGPGSNIDFEAENAPVAGNKYSVNIKSENPVQHLYVEIESETLTPVLSGVGLAPRFDLADGKGMDDGEDYTDAISGSLGLPVGDQVVGQKQILFDISDFVPMLTSFDGLHVFRLTAVDNAGNQKVLLIKFKV